MILDVTTLKAILRYINVYKKGGDIMANTNVKIKKDIFNETYLPYLMDYTHRDEIYYGGAGY